MQRRRGARSLVCEAALGKRPKPQDLCRLAQRARTSLRRACTLDAASAADMNRVGAGEWRF